jgi:replicative DNA helicase
MTEQSELTPEQTVHVARHWPGPCKEPPCPLEGTRFAARMQPVFSIDGLERWKERVRAAASEPKLRNTFGGDWILDGPDEPEPVWGSGAQVLWPKGEALVLVGGVGAGKTTIAGQAVLHGVGAIDGPFLGYPISLPPGVVGYVAADRPSQIRRSFRRMVGEDSRELLNERLDVWSGGLPLALDGARTGELADFVQDRGWTTLVVDSLKDLVANTTDDQSGLAINRQVQECLVRGIEVMLLHHQRKASEMNKKPKRLDDVYGSRWITAGAGSVLMVWGDAGASQVELSHLKPPAESVGPLALLHDHARGRTTVEGMADIAMPDRLTADDLLAALVEPGTLEDLMARTGRSMSTVKRRLSAIKDLGLVTESQASSTSPKVWTRVLR